MDRLNLPSGGWVDFHDPNIAIRGKHTHLLIQAAETDDDGNAKVTGDTIYGWAEIIAEPLISGWSVPYDPGLPLPTRTNHTLEELSFPDSRAVNDVLFRVARAAVKGDPYTEEAAAGEEQPETA